MPKLRGLSKSELQSRLNELDPILKYEQSLEPCPWFPQTGPQSLAYVCEADELFFGGSAGGGKSDLIIGLGRTAHINTLVLRTESTQLVGFKNRVQELMVAGDRWQGVGPHGGILRTADGRMMEFAGCESFEDANKKYRGRPHDLKAFDELPTFTQQVYEFLIGWNRSTVAGQRCRVVSAGNPPGRPEEEWVLDYWGPWLRTLEAEPGELRWFARIEGKSREVDGPEPFTFKGETIFPRSRTFIPARLEDNPILEQTGYRQTLQSLPEPYRSQLLYGDMQIGLTDDAHQLIPTEWIKAAQDRWTEQPPSDILLTSVGVDPSRGGKDRSIIAKRYGNWIAPLIDIPGKVAKDGPTLAPMVMLNIEWNFAPIIIDVTGTAGGGLYDSLNLLYRNAPIYGFNAAGASGYHDNSGRVKMRNLRTEAYWRLRDALDPANDVKFMLPPDTELRIELAAQRWYIYPSGAGLEDKEDIIKRLSGRSPDKADAVALTMMDSLATSGWGQVESRTPVADNPTFMGMEPSRRNSNPWGL